MSTNQLIAEITSGGFAQYQESGLVDPISLRTWIKNELKRFGTNIMDRKETIIHVKDNQAQLPKHFWQLVLAVQCDIKACETDDPSNILQNSFFYKERVEGIEEWNNGNESYENQTYKYVREEYYFHDATAKFYYGNPRLLRVAKGISRSVCAKDCPNLSRRLLGRDANTISLEHNFIKTDFREGTIYIQYDALPEDANGDFFIPETQHNRLKEYLLYYCRMRILEDVVMGDDDPSKWNQLNYFRGLMDDKFSLAQTEVKMEALANSDWKRRVRNDMRAQTLKYDLMLPTR